MDYKYIEQLLQKYFQAETTLDEERILQSFFMQNDIPQALTQYKSLFETISFEEKETTLGNDFDEKILAQIDKQHVVKAKTINFLQHLKPLTRAAAIVAVIITLTNSLQTAFSNHTQNTETRVATDGQVNEKSTAAQNDTIVKDTMLLITTIK